VARTEIVIAAAPERVFAVLSDPGAYANWVVGAQAIRSADPDWPAPGSALYHTVGAGPLSLRDRTRVVDSEAPVMLELHARARPLPAANVTLWLTPEGDGTRVTMLESPSQPVLSLLIGPVGHLALHVRNQESLRRLRDLCEA
jgi:uncharacterized protein YndB with AHSA1/START domain